MHGRAVIILSIVVLAALAGTAAGMSAPWQVESNVADAQMGAAVAIGDFNGDTYSDVAVGAPALNFLGGYDGRVFVYFGSAAGLATTAGWIAETDQTNSSFGDGLATGDFNGDTYDDLAVGAANYSNGQASEGAAFVWFGSSSGLGDPGTPANADWMAESNLVGSQLGRGLASAGDVNNDTWDDLLVGAERWGNGVSLQGAAMLFYGSATGLGPNGTPANADWIRLGGQAGSFFGGPMDCAGDVNGDNYDDVIISARSWDLPSSNRGQAYVFLGSASGLVEPPHWTGTGPTTNGFFGTDVAGAGDLNNDGYDDIAATATNFVMVWFGSNTGLGPDGDLFNADWSYGQGGSNGVAGAGDVDNDGYDDLLVSTTNLVRIFLGGESGPAVTPSWTFPEPIPGSDFGYSIDGAGNFNDDAYNDIVVGARLLSNPENNEGSAWMFLGGSDIVAATVQSYAAGWVDGAVELRWSLSDVVGVVNFEVYRRQSGSDYRLIVAPDIESDRGAYVLRDRAVIPGESYTYRAVVIEDGVPVAQFETSVAIPGLETRLLANHPNPFNPSTTIRFTIASESRVTLAVYDVSGRRVRTLADRTLSPGPYTTGWDGTDDAGGRVASGVYFLRLTSDKDTHTRTMVMVQ